MKLDSNNAVGNSCVLVKLFWVFAIFDPLIFSGE